jgi:hypothetical protein
MDSATHYRCGSVVDGKACKNRIRVRRDVAEDVILRPIVEQFLAPERVQKMVTEMCTYYAERMEAARAKQTKVPRCGRGDQPTDRAAGAAHQGRR